MLYLSNVDPVRCHEILIFDSPRNPGSDQVPDAAPAKVVKEQSLVLPNVRTRLPSQSYLNACSLKRLPQISCIKHSALTRQFLESLIELKRQGQQNWLLILGLVPLDPKLKSCLFRFDLGPRDGKRGPDSAAREIQERHQWTQVFGHGVT
jgi:hypothetical protein